MAANAKPSLIPAILALLIIILLGYLIYTDLDSSSREEHTVHPPIELIDSNDELPLTVITPEQKSEESNQIIAKEAKIFVENLSPAETESPIAIDENLDQFVRHDSKISIANDLHFKGSIEELLQDKTLAPDTKIALNFDSEEHKTTTLNQLKNQSEDHTETITILTDDGDKISKPLADIINQHTIDPDSHITQIINHQHHIETTFAELSSLGVDPNHTIDITIHNAVQELLIADLIPANSTSEEALFYLHRVTAHDKQGLWGIIQSGLINKFRQGLELEGVQRNKELVRAVIPADADEKLSSGLSSFLGKILNEKVDNSYIYNFRSKVMGKDANNIHPGQQLIMIQFSSDELTKIYQYFSDKRNQGTQTFGISD